MANDDHVCPDPPYVGQGWKITLRAREHPHAAEIRAQGKPRLSAAERRAMIIGRELIIHAADEQTARTAALLLHAAYCLIEGGMFSLFPSMANRRTAPSSL